MATIGLNKYYSGSDCSALFVDVSAFMEAIGWTLYDTVSSTNKVFSSNGEDGIYPTIYVNIYYSTATMNTKMYLYWDSVSHTGSVAPYDNTTSLQRSAAGYALMSGNKNVVCFFDKSQSHINIFGFCSKLFYPEITTLTSGASSGSFVSLEVGSTSGFSKGGYVQIVGVNSEGRDQLTINSITDSTHLVVNSLPRNYASGAFVGITPCPAFISGGIAVSRFDLLCPRSAVGTANGSSGQTMSDERYFPIQYAYIDPDTTSGYALLTPFYIADSDDSLVGYVDEIVLRGLTSAGDTNFDIFSVNYDANLPEQGMPTYATTTVLTDTSKSWTINEWADKYLIIINGTGSGQARKIASNTSTEITVVTAFDTVPGVSSTYRVVDKVYRSYDSYDEHNFVIFEDRSEL